jgi:hypothetical protein
MTTTLNVGEKVGYLSILGDNDFHTVGEILDVVQPGAVFKNPMVKVAGKSGYVLASHCVRIPAGA